MVRVNVVLLTFDCAVTPADWVAKQVLPDPTSSDWRHEHSVIWCAQLPLSDNQKKVLLERLLSFGMLPSTIDDTFATKSQTASNVRQAYNALLLPQGNVGMPSAASCLWSQCMCCLTPRRFVQQTQQWPPDLRFRFKAARLTWLAHSASISSPTSGRPSRCFNLLATARYVLISLSLSLSLSLCLTQQSTYDCE